MVTWGVFFAAAVNKTSRKLVMADVSHYLLLTLCSFLAYHVIYRHLTPLLLKALAFRPYSSLDKEKQNYVNFLYDSPAVRSLSAILLGYTAGETIVTLTDVGRTDLSLPQFLLHHVVSCWCTLVTCVYPCLPVYSNLVMATECSTIWLNIRVLLKEFGVPKSTSMNKCNNLVFFLTFSYVRVWLLVSKMYIPVTSLLMTKEFYFLELPVVITFAFCSQFFVAINLNWFSRLCRRFSSNDLGYGNDG
ncbi:uncharacterized protein LOC118406114 isoform X2 [Branchiostoma floridae]|uniref:Uncharacterized protein LOC118406114 isoform X2 n=1 Tax=Branchiostoma floridae TaxID=7739 RepID=A0A9J7HM02_BRAFL|nr:uncharacterized protein LOC118406114 isoform X2 [Branchiostoma floridae]